MKREADKKLGWRLNLRWRMSESLGPSGAAWPLCGQRSVFKWPGSLCRKGNGKSEQLFSQAGKNEDFVAQRRDELSRMLMRGFKSWEGRLNVKRAPRGVAV